MPLGIPLLTLSVAALASVTPPPVLPLPPQPPSGAQTLVARLANGLVTDDSQLGPAETYRITVSPREEPGTPQLADFLADSLEAALRRAGAQATRLVAASTAPATRRIDLALEITTGRLDVTARLVARPANLWERLREPAGRVLATASARAPTDLELRMLLGRAKRNVRLDRLRLTAVGRRSTPALLERPVLDLLVADLDGDGGAEVALVYPREVAIARWQDRGFASLAHTSLEQLPPNPAKVRAPIGRAVPLYRPDGRIDLLVATSDWATPTALRFDGATLRPAPVSGELVRQWPLYATGVDTWVGGVWPGPTDVLPPLVGAAALGGDWTPLARWEPVYDLRAHAHTSAASPAWNPHLVAALADGSVGVWSAADPENPIVLSRMGTAAAVSDLDGDGRPELAATTDTVAGADHVAVYELTASRQAARRRWRQRVPHPVTALTVGNLDGDAYDELLAASWTGTRADLHVVAPRVP